MKFRVHLFVVRIDAFLDNKDTGTPKTILLMAPIFNDCQQQEYADAGNLSH